MKRGLGDRYERATFPRLRAYVDLTKPLATISSFFITGFGVLLAFSSSGIGIGVQELWTAVFAGVTLALIHGGGQAMNMAEDAEVDKRNPFKENRPIPSGTVKKEAAHTLAWILILLGLVRGYTVTTSFGIICTLLAAMTILYNLPPIRVKDRAITSLLWRSASRGILPALAFWSVLGQPFHPLAISLGIIASMWVFTFQSVSDLPDIKYDREAGIDTLAAKLGTEKTHWFMLVLFLITMLSSIAIVNFLPLPFKTVPFVILLLGIIILVQLRELPMKASPITGMSPAWPTFYTGLGLLYLVPLLLSLAL